MGAIFNKSELIVLLRDFYQLTGLRAVVFDEYGMDILSYPSELPSYCKLIRQTEKGKLGCLSCDQNACRLAKARKEAVIYPCHAGLIEMIVPILVEDAAVGYLLLSHIVQGADETSEWQQARRSCAAYSIDEHTLHQAFLALPRTPFPTLKAASDMLMLAASALYLKGMARLAPGTPQERLSRYLNEHLEEKLSGQILCRELSISRTALYYLAQSTYGCGINEQITRMRLQKAMQLLAGTTLSNAEICQQTGFSDYNYFYRVFRRHTGLTPHQYRALIVAEGGIPEIDTGVL